MPDREAIVVGAGNAAMAASAHERRARRACVVGKATRSRDAGRWMARQGIVMQAAVSLRGARRHTCDGLRIALDLGALVSRLGRRLVDEGEDFRFCTYARPGGISLREPGRITRAAGGVGIDARARVPGASWEPIPRLHACGVMAGGLCHGNNPGCTGLRSGAIPGRIAGATAAGA